VHSATTVVDANESASPVKIVRCLSLLLLVLAPFTTPALAASTGSAATSTAEINLRLGPGAKYADVSVLAAGTDVIVERCQRRWCLVAKGAQRGWTSIDHLDFGATGRGPFTGPKLDRISGGSGTICFHTGLNYTGASVCAKTGMVVPDLALYGYDNAFASISVEGEISAHVCREFNFGSHCESISSNQPKLSRFLNRAVSSYRVW